MLVVALVTPDGKRTASGWLASESAYETGLPRRSLRREPGIGERVPPGIAGRQGFVDTADDDAFVEHGHVDDHGDTLVGVAIVASLGD